MNHPAIVRVIAYPDKSRPYLVTEHVEGQSLGHLMSRSGSERVAVGRVLAIGRQLCEALAYLHGEGIVHRDLTG